MSVTDVTNVVSLVSMSALLLSILIRLRPKSASAYAPLFWTQISIIVLLFLSLSWVYPVVDMALGGRNFLNLVSHLIFLGASWVYTTVLAEPFYRGRAKPVTLRSWVPAVAAIGAAISFVLLDPEVTSRGLEGFTSEPAWIGYWVFNIMTLWVPALTLVPQLLRAVKYTRNKALIMAYWAMIIGYSTSVLAMLGYVVTYFYPGLIPHWLLSQSHRTSTAQNAAPATRPRPKPLLASTAE